MKKILFFATFFISNVVFTQSFAQNDDAIKSIQFFLKGNEFSEPVYDMSVPEATLLLRFDELNAAYKYYFYTIQHCTPDWQPSNIFENDYLSGFFEQPITQYVPSINALQPYIHYTAEFPNENLQITKTGNYKIIVYEDGNKENPVFTKKFYVVRQQVGINAQITRPLMAQKTFTHQEINIDINTNQLVINNPFEEIKVVVQQNNRLDNIQTLVNPIFINEKQLTYTTAGTLQFEAGNEFRLLDLRTFNFKTEKMKYINKSADVIEIMLTPDDTRNRNRYLYYFDADGRFFIDLLDKFSPNDADYCRVTFTLPTTDSLAATNQVYLLGDAWGWQTQPANKMSYDDQTHTYYTTLLLKQGLYNYQYINKNTNPAATDTQFSVRQYEGNYYQAQNTYCVYIYHKPMSARHWSLAGFTKINSNRQ